MSFFLFQWLKPHVCFRKFYVMEKFEAPNCCKCVLSCKYPPPDTLEKITIPVKKPLNMISFKSKVLRS